MQIPKMWKRGENGAYYVQVNRKQVNLGRNYEAAKIKYRAIVARLESFSTTPVVILIDEFLEWVKQNREPGTYDFYRDALELFARSVGARLRISDLKPLHVTRWVSQWTGDNHKHNMIRAVQRCCNWAVKEGYLDRSPLTGMEKPQPVPRDAYTTPEQFAAIRAIVKDQEFRDFLDTLWETGCRPQEARTVTRQNIDWSGNRWVFEITQRGKLKSRVVYLNEAAFEITARLATEHPTGPIFRNRKGKPWRKAAVINRFQRLQKKIPFPATAYAIRHGWATRALKNGVDPLTVAKLMGHKDTRMLETIYQHVDSDGDFMREGLRRATATKGVVVPVTTQNPVDNAPMPQA